jgi:chaperonin GroES
MAQQRKSEPGKSRIKNLPGRLASCRRRAKKFQPTTGKFFEGVNIMAKLRPLADKILIKRLEAESKTKSGIVLPDSAKEKPKRGKILAVGDGKRLENGERAPFSVKKGDEVIFTSYAGTEIKLDGEEVIIMTEDDVLAIVE